MEENNINEIKAGDNLNIPEIKLQFETTQVYGKVNHSQACADLLRSLYPEGTIEMQEQVIVLYLNRANDVIGYYRHTLGGVNATIMDVKLILSTALKSLSSSIILAHNHPSGALKPSNEDMQITNKIKEAAQLIDVSLVDHLIITKDGYYSFNDEGMLRGLDGYAPKETEENIVNDKKRNTGAETSAKDFAKLMIRRFLNRGETISELVKSTKDFQDGNSSAELNKGKIHVSKLDGSKVSYSFPLSDIYYAVKDEKKVKSNSETANSKENQAREAAKDMIYGYVERGDSIESLKAGQMGVSRGEYSAQIKGNKIQVYQLNNKEVDFSFPLQSIFNEIVDELPTQPKNHNALKPMKKENPKKSKKAEVQSKPSARKSAKAESKSVERIEDEVRFIKRFAIMHEKEKTDVQLLNFLSALQKAIVEKRIRKTSPFKKEIDFIQHHLVDMTNRLRKISDPKKRQAKVKLDAKVLQHLREVGGSEKVRLSVNYLKRYMGIQGKHLTKEKAQRLFDTLKRAVKAGKFFADDPFAHRLQAVWTSLSDFLKVAKAKDTLEVHSEVLNGLNAALDGCSCEEKKKTELESLNPAPLSVVNPNTIMNSLDFAKLKFDTLGFTGKWLNLIGDPCAGFTAMVFGKPKMGKSYLCVDFAGYLARHHGDTLYVAKEEKLDATLQKKLNDKDVKHRCLFVSDHLPEDLSPYQFIFLDSVSKLRLSPQDLEKLKSENRGKSFIDVFQTTKAGNFRGTNEHQHDVDVVIEIPEKGKAVQFGRFNQGGEMDIFPNESQLKMVATQEVMGIKQSKSSTKKNQKFDILSPDGFSIRIGIEPFTSMKQASEYFIEWKDRYKIQGYYSSVPYGHIPLQDLEDYCEWVVME